MFCALNLFLVFFFFTINDSLIKRMFISLWYVNEQSEVSHQSGVQNHESDRMATRTKRREDERAKQGMWKRVVARDEGSRHSWKALMRRYCLERHCRLRKLFLRGNNYVTSREYILDIVQHCWNSTAVIHTPFSSRFI